MIQTTFVGGNPFERLPGYKPFDLPPASPERRFRGSGKPKLLCTPEVKKRPPRIMKPVLERIVPKLSQASVKVILRARLLATSREVAEELGVSATNTSYVMKRMRVRGHIERKGKRNRGWLYTLVEREAPQDRVLVYLKDHTKTSVKALTLAMGLHNVGSMQRKLLRFTSEGLVTFVKLPVPGFPAGARHYSLKETEA